MFTVQKSLTTLNKQDPVSEYNSQLWNTGIEANKEIARKQKRRLMLVTALNSHIGYDKAAEVAKKAYKENISLRDAIVDLGYLSGEDFDQLVQPEKMIKPNKSN